MPQKSKHNRRGQKPTKPTAQKHKRRGWLVAFVGIGLSVLGLILWLPFYIVDIYIDIASSSNDPLMPVPTSFSVTNRGVLKAYSADFVCYYIHIRLVDSPTISDVTIDGDSTGPAPLATVLQGNQSLDTVCPGIIGPLALESDIQFLLSFSPQFTWKRSYACARFTVKQNAHGKRQWFRTAPHECKPLWLDLQARREKMEARINERRRKMPR